MGSPSVFKSLPKSVSNMFVVTSYEPLTTAIVDLNEQGQVMEGRLYLETPFLGLRKGIMRCLWQAHNRFVLLLKLISSLALEASNIDDAIFAR